MTHIDIVDAGPVGPLGAVLAIVSMAAIFGSFYFLAIRLDRRRREQQTIDEIIS